MALTRAGLEERLEDSDFSTFGRDVVIFMPGENRTYLIKDAFDHTLPGGEIILMIVLEDRK